MTRRAGAASSTSPTSGSGPTRAAPAPAPRSGRGTTTPSPGWVIAVDRGRYTVLLGGPDDPGAAQVTAMKARELGRAGVVVGDRVALVGDVTGDARLAGPHRAGRGPRQPAAAQRRRRRDGADAVERPIVANADQLAVVTALADPEPRPRLVDRASSPPTTPASTRCSS